MPALGRWASVDPPGGEFPEWSPYNYVNNDPVSRYDRLGLCPNCGAALVGAAVFGGIRLGYNLLNDRPWDEGLLQDMVVGGAIGFTLGAAAPALVARGGLLAFGAGRAVASGSGSGMKVALGIREHLDEFAESHGASTWKQWGSTNFKERFMETMNNTSNEILFNLKGVDVWGGVQRAASGRGGATDWELLQIKNNSQWWDRVQFIKDGVQINNPFAK
jgi:hypothetical protein